MTIEATWYQCFSPAGEPPKMRRLSRQPLDRQWAAAIDLAIAFAAGEAGYRLHRIALTGEVTWLWPQPEGDWWLIPHRVDQRVFALHNTALETELRRGQGPVGPEAIVGRLKVWRRSGHWRSIASTIYPRHGTPTDAPFALKTRRRRTALTPA